jgi:hypothetical protein
MAFGLVALITAYPAKIRPSGALGHLCAAQRCGKTRHFASAAWIEGSPIRLRDPLGFRRSPEWSCIPIACKPTVRTPGRLPPERRSRGLVALFLSKTETPFLNLAQRELPLLANPSELCTNPYRDKAPRTNRDFLDQRAH